MQNNNQQHNTHNFCKSFHTNMQKYANVCIKEQQQQQQKMS